MRFGFDAAGAAPRDRLDAAPSSNGKLSLSCQEHMPPDNFHRINQKLRRDNGFASTAGVGAACALLAAWAAWAMWAKVTQYEMSKSARLEVSASAYPLQANISGRVSRSGLVLGRSVQAGEVLVEIDSSVDESSVNEQRAALSSLVPEIAALESQAAAERDGDAQDRLVSGFASAAAAAQLHEAEVQAESAAEQARRASKLRTEGILAVADAEKVVSDAQAKRSAADALRSAASRIPPEVQLRHQDREVRLRQIFAEETKFQAQRASIEAAIGRLNQQLERFRVRAPVAGRIAECSPLQPGVHVAEGQQLAVILPGGGTHVIAEFAPADALGHIRPGQAATVRLQGFPWGQYGTVSARVSKIADEIHDGSVRVELSVVSAPPRIPLQHGIPGSVEIAVERTTPAAMLLRAAGAAVGGAGGTLQSR